MKLLFFFAELLDYFGDHDTETRLMSLYEVTMPEVYAFIMCATVARTRPDDQSDLSSYIGTSLRCLTDIITSSLVWLRTDR